LYESDRRIQVEWAPMPTEPGAASKSPTYPVKITIVCEDRAGMLKEFTAIISEDGTNIRSMDSKGAEDGYAIVDFVVETVDLRHLNRMVERLRRVSGVREVHRVQKI
jgi:guanosine-3',5'-bis(diphosphate) 3'-pyrophosphohydrolase